MPASDHRWMQVQGSGVPQLEVAAEVLRDLQATLSRLDTTSTVHGAHTLAVPGSQVSGANASATLTAQLKDSQGKALSGIFLVTAWLSDAQGGAVSATTPSGAITFVVGALVKELTTKLQWQATTDINGRLSVNVAQNAAQTWYLNLESQGKVTTSAPIIFT